MVTILPNYGHIGQFCLHEDSPTKSTFHDFFTVSKRVPLSDSSRSRKNSGALASPASTTKPFPCPPPAESRRHRPALSHARRRAHTEPSCAGATARWRSPARFCYAHYFLGFMAQNVATHPSSHAPSTPAPQPSPQRTPGAPLVTSWRLGPPESRRWPIWAILASNHKRARM
jgi:hypothetical protein